MLSPLPESKWTFTTAAHLLNRAGFGGTADEIENLVQFGPDKADAYCMWRQNETFRRLATGNWLQLQIAVAKDPAMLIWLDQAQSRKEHPNENYAREVMELFALGEGHYTEQDISEAARALTGWTL